jgi:hypothetical protein
MVMRSERWSSVVLIDIIKHRAVLPAEVLSHAVTPEAIADVVAFLVSDATAPISGAILPAYVPDRLGSHSDH